MLRRRLFSVLAVVALMQAVTVCLQGCTSQDARRNEPLDAAQIIDRYFEAIGGRAEIEQVQNMIIHGRYGHVFAPGDTMTLYLKKPQFIRRETSGRVVSFTGDKGYVNSFGELTEADGDNLTSLRYYAGFFHNAFSLLKFGEDLDQAQYIGERQLGQQREHIITIPHGGIDYEVHFHADSFLIDRIVFPYGDPQEGTRMVNSLKNYRDVNGILMPSEVIFDVVGREAAPMKLEPLNIEMPADLDDSLFDKPTMDIAAPTMEDGVLVSTIYDDTGGILLTTVRIEHMQELGIQPGEFMTFEVEGNKMSVRYVENIHSGFKGAQLGDYIAIYYQTPLLAILVFGEGGLNDVFPFKKGQVIRIWPTEKGDS